MRITTVDNIKSRLSAHDFSKAKIARALQHRVGRPVTNDFIPYVAETPIQNYAITMQDITFSSSHGDLSLGV